MRVTNRSSLDFEQPAERDLAALVENLTKWAGPKDREALLVAIRAPGHPRFRQAECRTVVTEENDPR